VPDDLSAELLFDKPVVIAAGMRTRWARNRKIKGVSRRQGKILGEVGERSNLLATKVSENTFALVHQTP
jgi:hypothetical protein